MKKHLYNKLAITVVISFFVITPLMPAQGNSERNEADDFQTHHLFYIEKGPNMESRLYVDGSVINIKTQIVARLMSGSNPTNATLDDLKTMTKKALEDLESLPDNPEDADSRNGLNIVFNIDGSVPGDAITALGIAEVYIESVFDDSVTVYINVDFDNLGGGVLGQTASNYASSVTWTNTRSGLINGMDTDDTIQNWLPAGSTIPVRYNGGSSTVTDENRCFFTTANYESTIGSIGGTDAWMTFNNQFSWDYDPSNGVSGASFCFQSVVIHEVGHALGFTSGADFRTNDIETLDIYRFERTDETGSENPETYSEFQTFARLVDWNTPNDDHNSDLISVEYRMSDGDPYQASHFRQGSVNGIMQPAIGSGTTFYPNFYRTADITMFDAIGWDYTTVPSYTLTVNIDGNGEVIKNPDQPTYLEGTVVELTAQPDPGWLFSHWSGDDIDGSTDNPETITMDSDKEVTAHFTAIPYTLTTAVDGNGSVIKNPDQPSYIYGTIVELTAEPDTDWSFCYWSGDDIDGSTTNPEMIIMNGDKAVTAHFTVSPEWRNQGQNKSIVEVGGRISLYAEGMDDQELDWAWLSTNESGEWEIFAGGEWWDNHWYYKKEIIIDHSLVPDDLVNFPLLIVHTSSDLIPHAQPDGDDFVFIDATNTLQYSHEIEYYDDTSGELVAWVNIPFLSSTQDTIVYLYYGNPSCSNQENLPGVWNEDFLMIHHMTGGSYSDLDDSTINHWDITSQGGNPSFNELGIAGRCVDFDGSFDYLKAEDFDLPIDSSYTGSAWVYVDGRSGQMRNAFEGDDDFGISLLVWTTDMFKSIAHSSGGTAIASGTTTVDVGNPSWHYICTRANAAGDELEIIVNGVSEDTVPISGTINAVHGLNIGTNMDNNNNWMDGKIDEIRISNIVRSDSWIITEYNNVVFPDSFTSVGPEVPRGGEKHGSPLDISSGPGEWVYTEFVWQEPSLLEGTVVGWKIIYVDTWRNQCETDVMSFYIVDHLPISIVGARSIRSHAGTEYALDLFVNNIESRVNGVQIVEFDLSDTADASAISASVECVVAGPYGGTIIISQVDTDTIRLTFDPALPDQDACTITLTGEVEDSFCVRTLECDVDFDGQVLTVDASKIKSRFQDPIDGTNFWYDVDCDNQIITVDASKVKSRFQHTCPPSP